MRALFVILFASAVAANATQISLNLDSATLSGLPGQMLDFTGTLTNNTGATLFINSDSFTFAINGALDDSPFLLNAPLSINAGVTSADFEIFDVIIPGGQALGPYTGSFTVLGGTDGSQQNNLGSASFTVEVTPEPASYLLISCAVALLLAYRGLRSTGMNDRAAKPSASRT